LLHGYLTKRRVLGTPKVNYKNVISRPSKRNQGYMCARHFPYLQTFHPKRVLKLNIDKLYFSILTSDGKKYLVMGLPKFGSSRKGMGRLMDLCNNNLDSFWKLSVALKKAVGVFETTEHVGFTGFLGSHNGWALKTKISLEVLGDFSELAL
jgi:hypothetical protein